MGGEDGVRQVGYGGRDVVTWGGGEWYDVRGVGGGWVGCGGLGFVLVCMIWV